ncbi:MAG: hypothetical protein IJI14_00830 [Anaerolineaceae bacterium]|nr:hypothetical protein [Anaerolineaceae bacterium]
MKKRFLVLCMLFIILTVLTSACSKSVKNESSNYAREVYYDDGYGMSFASNTVMDDTVPALAKSVSYTNDYRKHARKPTASAVWMNCRNI